MCALDIQPGRESHALYDAVFGRMQACPLSSYACTKAAEAKHLFAQCLHEKKTTRTDKLFRW